MKESSLHVFWDYDPRLMRDYHSFKIVGVSSYNEIMLARQVLPKKISVDIIIMDCWNIRMQRNIKIFRNEAHEIDSWRFKIKVYILVKYMTKIRNPGCLDQWIDYCFDVYFPQNMIILSS